MSCGPNRGCNAVPANVCRVAGCALTTANANTQLFRNLRSELRTSIAEVNNNVEVQLIPAPNAAPFTDGGGGGTVDLTGADPIAIISATRILDAVTINLHFNNVGAMAAGVLVVTLGTLDPSFRPSTAIASVFTNPRDATGGIAAVGAPFLTIGTDGVVTMTLDGVSVYGAGFQFTWEAFSYPV